MIPELKSIHHLVQRAAQGAMNAVALPPNVSLVKLVIISTLPQPPLPMVPVMLKILMVPILIHSMLTTSVL